jgi:hypothetical protein
MMEFILHMHNHAGWSTQTIEAKTLTEALTKGLNETAEFLSKEYAEKYKVEHDDPADKYPRYRILWNDDEPKTFYQGTPLNKGDVWWSDRFQVGKADDCTSCGGTGINHYNSFMQCWKCGDREKEGKGTGKI